jgi:hypothetical protein
MANTINNLTVVKLDGGQLGVKTIVTRSQGSWIYQKAFGFSTYIPVRRKTRCKKSAYIWQQVSSYGKFSEPQIRDAFRSMQHGTLHNRPVTAEQLQLLALAEEIYKGSAL